MATRIPNLRGSMRRSSPSSSRFSLYDGFPLRSVPLWGPPESRVDKSACDLSSTPHGVHPRVPGVLDQSRPLFLTHVTGLWLGVSFRHPVLLDTLCFLDGPSQVFPTVWLDRDDLSLSPTESRRIA